ncbi:hypothetical protein [Paraburkholderia fynbosensis]|uniref:hypothetical protein n=1 Tax=Paraburkholderia fynbosensis TaxID=1200993 RepID=UPI001583C357|nr:hypothetical protein [Paraburkholderia fynbosensis]
MGWFETRTDVRAVLLPAIVPVVAFRHGISLVGEWDAGWREVVDIALGHGHQPAHARHSSKNPIDLFGKA